MDQLGLVLRLTRIQQRIKQVELARIMEISPSTLSAIENGRRRPTQLQAYKINNALGKQIFNEDQD
jgi:transcriptional regulator with XRE-family HTH domain